MTFMKKLEKAKYVLVTTDNGMKFYAKIKVKSQIYTQTQDENLMLGFGAEITELREVKEEVK